jgi:hypothetical protein
MTAAPPVLAAPGLLDRLRRLDARLTPRAAGLLAAALLLMAAAAWWLGWLRAERAGTPWMGGVDFQVFHRAAGRFASGEPLYRPGDGHYAFKYAPAVAMLLAPLRLLPPAAAALAWGLVSALALAGFMVWSARRAGAGAAWSHLAVTVLTLPFSLHLFPLGQMEAVLLWLVSRSEEQAERRPWLSGALWAAAALAKPPFLLLAPAAVGLRQWRRLVALAVFLAAGLAAPALRYGLSGALAETGAWRGLLAATTPGLLCDPQNQSAWAIACTYLARPPGPGYAVAAGAVALLGTAGAAGAAALAWRRQRPAGALASQAAALWLTAFLSPLGWRTNLLGAIPALYLLVDRARAAPVAGARRLALAGALALFLVQRLNYEVVGRERFFALLEWRHYGLSAAAAVLCALWALAWSPGRRQAS